jgi:YHS domain-containing protein
LKRPSLAPEFLDPDLATRLFNPMIRALFELLITIMVVFVARALLATVLKGISRASSDSFQPRAADPRSRPASSSAAPGPQVGGELHKDPVCGTYVAETTAFRRQSAGQTFYYCSSDCREKHALVAR